MARSARVLRAAHHDLQPLQPLGQQGRGAEDICEAGERGEARQAVGCSCGGRTTKIHALVDGRRRPISFVLTAGQVHDTQAVADILNGPSAAFAIAADKAYDSQTVRQQIKDDGAVPVIPILATCACYDVLWENVTPVCQTIKKGQPVKAKPLFSLVAGVGFEPTTFRL